DMKTILDIVNASSGRNSATEDKFLNRILYGRYDAGFTAKLQLKDIRLYLEAARATGIADAIASAVVDLWQRMDAAMPGADITDMYRYTRQRGQLERGRERSLHAAPCPRSQLCQQAPRPAPAGMSP